LLVAGSTHFSAAGNPDIYFNEMKDAIDGLKKN